MPKVDRNLLARYPLPPVQGGSKEQRGRVLVVAGDPRLPGTAVLVAEAAIRAGAGRLQISVPGELTVATGIACPEALVAPFDELEPLLDDVDAIAVGAGMFDGPAVKSLCARVANASACALVFDAGAFGALHDEPALLHARASSGVLTPHSGELARLLNVERDDVESQPQDYALQAARDFQTVTVLKGQRTYIATPDGACFEHDGGTSGLAVSGSGDALTGILSGFLARRAEPLTAALWAVAVHGESGRRLEQRTGLGFLAREIAGEVPAIVREWSAA